MGLFEESQQKIIRRKLEAMKEKVSIVYFTQEVECAFCRETHAMLREVAALSDKLALEIFDFREHKAEADRYGIDKIPAIVVRNGKDPGIRFYGIPAGYEFSTFLEDLVMVSRGDSGLSQPSREALKAVAAPVHLQVFVTPTCPYCPAAVRLAHQAALESDWIRADAVEISEFPHLAQKYLVMGVPKTVINEKISIEGALPESAFIQEILAASKA